MKEVSKRFINLHQHYNPLQCLQAPMVRHSLKVKTSEIDLAGKSVIYMPLLKIEVRRVFENSARPPSCEIPLKFSSVTSFIDWQFRTQMSWQT